MAKRKNSKSKKGGMFEREMSKEFSMWWTNYRHDDLFWRSQASGARATIRSRRGKKTKGQAGDLCAVDERGAEFTQLFTIECKRGYKDSGFDRVLDKSLSMANQQWESFILQTLEAQKINETPFWMLVLRRDQRIPVVFIPIRAYLSLIPEEFQMKAPVVMGYFKVANEIECKFAAITLDNFFELVTPEVIRTILQKELKNASLISEEKRDDPNR